MADELESLDATAIAAHVRSGQLGAEEVVRAALERLDRCNPALNAVVDVWHEDALAQARATRPQGRLAGVPVLLKDSLEFPGKRHSMGSRLRLQTLGRQADPWVEALRAEGVVFLGKTNMPEFGLSDVTEPLAFGPTLNPWGREHSVGGSSGGAAAAVAARIVPLAHGTDGGGSIRFPAACCGVFGLKPSRGRTGTPPPSFDPRLPATAVGHALTLSVRDNALVLAITEQALRGGAGARASKESRPFLPEPLQRPLKVALIDEPLHGGELAPAHAAAVEQAATRLRALGHEVIRCCWPIDARAFHAAFFDRWAHAVHREVQALAEEARRPFLDGVEPWTRGLASHGAALPPERVEAVVQTCLEVSTRMADFHRSWDVLLTPIAAVHPLPLGWHAPDLEFTTLFERVGRNVAFTPLHNVTGQPAMSVPLVWGDDGMPLGVHFAAAEGCDEQLLQLALQLEGAHPWAHRRPPSLETA